MTQKQSQKLLEAYRSLWHNRRLDSVDSDEAVLLEAIRRDLLDESTHPRTRRTVQEKFYSAAKRIVAADLDDTVKSALIEIHVKLAEQILGEKE